MTKVLTASEVRDILKIGKNQTYALMNNKAFPSYRIGNKMFVTEDALNEWLKSIENKQFVA
jgi:excisionase family DNA binding protein